MDPTSQAGRRPATSAGELFAVGTAATAVALAALWAVSSIAPSVDFPPTALAEAIVRVMPGDAATFFIEHLGHWAMRALTVGVIAGSLLLGAVTMRETAGAQGPRPWHAGALLAVTAFAAAFLGNASDVALAPLVVAITLAFASYVATASLLLASSRGEAADLGRRRVLSSGVGAALGVAVAGSAL